MKETSKNAAKNRAYYKNLTMRPWPKRISTVWTKTYEHTDFDWAIYAQIVFHVIFCLKRSYLWNKITIARTSGPRSLNAKFKTDRLVTKFLLEISRNLRSSSGSWFLNLTTRTALNKERSHSQEIIQFFEIFRLKMNVLFEYQNLDFRWLTCRKEYPKE